MLRLRSTGWRGSKSTAVLRLKGVSAHTSSVAMPSAVGRDVFLPQCSRSQDTRACWSDLLLRSGCLGCDGRTGGALTPAGVSDTPEVHPFPRKRFVCRVLFKSHRSSKPISEGVILPPIFLSQSGAAFLRLQ